MRTRGGIEQIDPSICFVVGMARGKHHTFGHAELHLAWREVCNECGESANELRRLVGRFDPRENVAMTAFTDV